MYKFWMVNNMSRLLFGKSMLVG
uniref:Uncharacterized protein n=1 Tax=Anguilla anguilla TaxID=7936 RepID=A0A0E9RB59_ANGAN